MGLLLSVLVAPRLSAATETTETYDFFFRDGQVIRRATIVEEDNHSYLVTVSALNRQLRVRKRDMIRAPVRNAAPVSQPQAHAVPPAKNPARMHPPRLYAWGGLAAGHDWGFPLRTANPSQAGSAAVRLQYFMPKPSASRLQGTLLLYPVMTYSPQRSYAALPLVAGIRGALLSLSPQTLLDAELAIGLAYVNGKNEKQVQRVYGALHAQLAIVHYFYDCVALRAGLAFLWLGREFSSGVGTRLHVGATYHF